MKIESVMSEDKATTCGLFSWRPHWLQRFANHRFYLTLYSVIGVVMGIIYSYVTVVLSTVEKQFGIQSKVGPCQSLYSKNVVFDSLCFLAPAGSRLDLLRQRVQPDLLRGLPPAGGSGEKAPPLHGPGSGAGRVRAAVDGPALLHQRLGGEDQDQGA